MKDSDRLLLADALSAAIESNYTIIKQRKIIAVLSASNIAFLGLIICMLIA